ncbi:MAG: hypothetical protein ACD_78C00187G0001 [uncultured bacterium (gcode 4)]|uniref:Gcp-like domain-containing protein n=1 Tax=uncultured bacterium (gcode 4) TaxID=1234023 RepID=K1YXB6_9BACT|nr:MAG: hypothetical protein ACD_78C00187G0001 [uncultured bacterium (gcode 4)]
MHLFINTIPEVSTYILFDSERIIRDRKTLTLKWHESEQFLATLEGFLLENSLTFAELEGIVVVNGPGSFTAMRIVTLTVNTLAFVHKTPLYSLDFFSLAVLAWLDYPMLMKANRGEYLLRKSEKYPPAIIPIGEVPSWHYAGLGDTNDFTNGGISIQSELDYGAAIRNLALDTPTQRIDPFYIKKPNIT